MGLIYHAALENSLIICFMDSRLWNAPLPVFFRLVDALDYEYEYEWSGIQPEEPGGVIIKRLNLTKITMHD